MEVFLKQEGKSESINNIQKEREMKELQRHEGRKKEKGKFEKNKGKEIFACTDGSFSETGRKE